MASINQQGANGSGNGATSGPTSFNIVMPASHHHRRLRHRRSSVTFKQESITSIKFRKKDGYRKKSMKQVTGGDTTTRAASRNSSARRDRAIVKLLLEHDPELSKTVGQSNATPLVSAATKGHTTVVRGAFKDSLECQDQWQKSSVTFVCTPRPRGYCSSVAGKGSATGKKELIEKDRLLYTWL
ncbi:hypothetical protein HAX54_051959 [Datura stramonium]|uniref:Uncharacterized protein n=1 Tax=Datura stramonium TaxID=4076 RepID=A0ABS8SZ10_DATST|nr:hypothetical protein [Datura stramonium]